MKILIVTKHYLARGGGGPNVSRAFIKALCQIFDEATLLYPDDRDKPMAKLFGEGVSYVPCYDDRSRLRKGIDVYLGKTHRMLPMVQTVLSQQDFDIIFIDHSSIANGVLPYVKTHSHAKVVTIHHNVEYDYLHDNPFPWFFRWPMNRYCIEAERESLQQSDLGLVLTEADRQRLSELYQVPTDRLVSIGVFNCDDLQAENFELPTTRKPENIVITGQLCFPQSTVPLIDFLNNFYPKLKAAVPDIHLIVAGRNPSEAVCQTCGRQESVELIPNPVDMSEILDRGSIYLCPTDRGSGVKLRIFDGLRAGMPVVVHRNSLYGYEPLVSRGIVYPYDDSASLLQAITALRAKAISPIDVRRAFADHYSFTAGKNRMASILRDKLR